MCYLVKQFEDLRADADALGIAQRTGERYVKRPDPSAPPPRCQEVVRARCRPRVREHPGAGPPPAPA
jgi:hypothetical protein